MTIQVFPQAFTVCKAARAESVDLNRPFCFTGKTDGELSLVCETERVPPDTLTREDGWRMFRVAGAMAFTLVGVLAGLTGALAARGVAVFAISTFDTDYVLVKAEQLKTAADALVADGCAVEWLP